MRRLTWYLIIIGAASALLYLINVHFVLLAWADGMQPTFGIALAVAGVVLLVVGYAIEGRKESAEAKQLQGFYGSAAAPVGPPPGYPQQQAYPQQSFPQQPHPQQPYPPQGFPPQGFPPQGFPQQPHPPQQQAPGPYGPQR